MDFWMGGVKVESFLNYLVHKNYRDAPAGVIGRPCVLTVVVSRRLVACTVCT